MRFVWRVGFVVAGMALMAGCSGPGSPSTPPASVSAAAPASSSPEISVVPAPGGAPASGAAPRCHTAQLAAELGGVKSADGAADDQHVLSLVYTNTSSTACTLKGIPGLDLHGPADPNGPVYTLRRGPSTGSTITLAPGRSASARLVILSDSPGSFGSEGSRNWVPTQLVTIPPGETTPLTVPWPAGLTVMRQDEATHPGSWIDPFAG